MRPKPMPSMHDAGADAALQAIHGRAHAAQIAQPLFAACWQQTRCPTAAAAA